MPPSNALIERERKRQPRRMAKLALSGGRSISLALNSAANDAADTVEAGNGLLASIVRGNKLVSVAIYRHNMRVWREFSDTENLGIQKTSVSAREAARISREATKAAELIGNGTLKRIEKIIKQESQDKGILSNVAGKIRWWFGSRASRRGQSIAGTETTRVANQASQSAASLAGARFKTWVTAADEKVRPCHQIEHGVTIPASQLFTVCGEAMDYPGDMSNGAGLANVLNCRCHLVFSVR